MLFTTAASSGAETAFLHSAKQFCWALAGGNLLKQKLMKQQQPKCFSSTSSSSGKSVPALDCAANRFPAGSAATTAIAQYSTINEAYQKTAEKLKESTNTTENTEKAPPQSISTEEIERLLQRHQIKGVSMPVRAEFVREKPLSTTDLEHIDIRVYHRKPETISDHVAYRSVKLLRFFADAFFRKRYVHRAIVLETVAGVPGMVSGMLCHMRSLRRMQHDNGWIEKLLHEAENERMHLMIWMEVTKPTWLERFLVTFVQGVFFNAYMVYYLLFPRTAHRFVGYLEEEAIVSYNAFAEEIRQGRIENTPAPKVAINYYNLDPQARLIDCVYAVRADEAAHRDANHNFADRIDAHKENLSPKK